MVGLMPYHTDDTVTNCDSVDAPVTLDHQLQVSYRFFSGKDWPTPVFQKPIRIATKDQAKDYVEGFDNLKICQLSLWGVYGNMLRHYIEAPPDSLVGAAGIVFIYNRFCSIPSCKCASATCFPFIYPLVSGTLPTIPSFSAEYGVGGGHITIAPSGGAGGGTVTGISSTGRAINGSWLPGGLPKFGSSVFLGITPECGACAENWAVTMVDLSPELLEEGCAEAVLDAETTGGGSC